MQENTQRLEPSGPQPASQPATPPPAAATQRLTPPPTSAPQPAPPEPRGLDSLRAQPATDTTLLPEVTEPIYVPMTLSVGAGFKFGCGFLLALAFAALALFLVASVVFFVASLMGLPLPLGVQ